MGSRASQPRFQVEMSAETPAAECVPVKFGNYCLHGYYTGSWGTTQIVAIRDWLGGSVLVEPLDGKHGSHYIKFEDLRSLLKPWTPVIDETWERSQFVPRRIGQVCHITPHSGDRRLGYITEVRKDICRIDYGRRRKKSTDGFH